MHYPIASLELLGEFLPAVFPLPYAEWSKLDWQGVDDPEALDLLDQATVGKHGGSRTAETKFNMLNLPVGNKKTFAPMGNSRQRALRVLRKADPEKYEEVRSGSKKAAVAMREAGLRRRVVQIYPEDADLSAAAIRRTHTPKQVTALVTALRRIRGEGK